jgi:hypothetical protein
MYIFGPPDLHMNTSVIYNMVYRVQFLGSGFFFLPTDLVLHFVAVGFPFASSTSNRAVLRQACAAVGLPPQPLIWWSRVTLSYTPATTILQSGRRLRLVPLPPPPSSAVTVAGLILLLRPPSGSD